MIQKDPGFIIGPIARFMGWIIDFIFNIVYPITEKNSLGISIIILTIIIRFLILPLAIKSQKSMIAMQKLAPEMDKIKKKYGDSKDPENQKKMNMEMQALYSKNKVSPFGGCLPLIIQMPIFFSLTYLMNQSFLYIAKLRSVYDSLAIQITSLQSHISRPLTDWLDWEKMLAHVGLPHVPSNMQPFQFVVNDLIPIKDQAGAIPDLTQAAANSNMIKLLNRLTEQDWASFFNGTAGIPGIKEYASPEQLASITSLFQQKNNIEMFFGLNLLNNAGWLFPGIIIPILAALTTFASSWLSMKLTAQTNKDSSAVTQQKIMMVFSSLLFVFFTINSPVGVGIYWITSTVFQVIQQAFLNKIYGVNLSVQKEDTKQHVG